MQRLKNFAIAIVVLALLVIPSTTLSRNQERTPEFSLFTTSQSVEPQGPRTPPTKFVKTQKPIPNRYIIVLDDNVVPDNLPLEVRRERIAAIANSHAQTHGGKVDYIYETALKGYAIELSNEAAARAISNLPRVRLVQEDGYGEWTQAPPSPQPSPPWGLDAIDGTMPAPTPDANGRTTGFYNYGTNGSGVSAYLLDSGINTAHTEFQTPFMSRAIQAADCFTFVNCTSGTLTPLFNQQACVFPMPNSTNNDCLGHGTHVAGVLGGNTFGVAKNVVLRSVKVGSTNGPIISAVMVGVNWVTGHHQANSAIPAVANMSLELPTNSVETEVRNSLAAGVTYVVAAGNGGIDARNRAPANVSDALTVGAVDWNGSRPSFSNWGPAVDLFAPGVSVVSARTGNGFLFECSPWNGANNTTCLLSGTSQATAHVSGAVAMYLQGRLAVSNTCGAFPIDRSAATLTLSVSTCPDRVARFIKANAILNRLSNIDRVDANGNIVQSPNRFLWTGAIPPPANPIDNNQFFVWSQYTDFLNREPDSIGFNNWTSNLNSCGSDWPCLNNQRIHTVRGMIESAEFRQGKPALSNPSSTDEYNREYIRQLYLCLLRRDPDTNGFATYVSELNSTGDYDHAVHGFINGTEYRRRFGPP
jgi:subtilisin family serine protease